MCGRTERYAYDLVRAEALAFSRATAQALVEAVNVASAAARSTCTPEVPDLSIERMSSLADACEDAAHACPNVVHVSSYRNLDVSDETGPSIEVFVAMIAPSVSLPNTFEVLRLHQAIRPHAVTVMVTSAYLSFTSHLAQRMTERSTACGTALRLLGEGIMETAAFLSLGARIWRRLPVDGEGRRHVALPVGDGFMLGHMRPEGCQFASGRRFGFNEREEDGRIPHRLRMSNEGETTDELASHVVGMTYIGPREFWKSDMLARSLMRDIARQHPITRLLGFQVMWPDSWSINKVVRMHRDEVAEAHGAYLSLFGRRAIRQLFRIDQTECLARSERPSVSGSMRPFDSRGAIAVGDASLNALPLFA